MIRFACVVFVVGLGCSKKEKEEPPAAKEKSSWSDRLGDLGDKAKDLGDKAKTVGGDLGDKAKSLGGDAVDKAKSVGGDVADKAKTVGGDVADKASELSATALAAGKQLKSELAKVVSSKLDYDFAIDAIDESAADHEARRARMKQLTVGTTSVGFAQDAKHPAGTTYSWQFRVVWRLPDGRTARLSIFTNEDLAEAAFAALLVNIIPLAPTLLGA